MRGVLFRVGIARLSCKTILEVCRIVVAYCPVCLFSGVTSILAKCGILNTDSDIATALRTIVVLVFSWEMVFLAGSAHTISDITTKSVVFLILSGFATGASWLCYFRALSMGDVNKVVPIDKLSIVVTVLFSYKVCTAGCSPF